MPFQKKKKEILRRRFQGKDLYLIFHHGIKCCSVQEVKKSEKRTLIKSTFLLLTNKIYSSKHL